MKTLLWLSALALAGPAAAQTPTSAELRPEGASGRQATVATPLKKAGIVSAHPLASEAGWQMLRAGGSALDAAIAAQMVLGLVEPQSSGIGGGAFLLHHDGRRVQAFDGRETAPAAAGPDWFLQADGKPLPFAQAVASGLSVGVPGVVRMLEDAHRQHGRLPWARLMQPAIRLAESGFAVTPRLHALLLQTPDLAQDPVARAYFLDAQGQPWPVGHRLRNPDYAAQLRRIARLGSAGFYEGPTAQAVVRTVRAHPLRSAPMRLSDLREYRALEREALCLSHQASAPAWPQAVRICGLGPPSSGLVAVGQILGLMARQGALALPWGPDGLPTPVALHAYAEASRLAFADRARYLADPAFVGPRDIAQRLLSVGYLDQRARQIGAQPAPSVAPGDVASGQGPLLASMAEQPESGTSHLSVIDAKGRAVSMTTTVESAFGSRRMVNQGVGRVGGFLLNNQLTDFSLAPTDAQGRPVANRVEAGKRPRSSMSPLMVQDAQSGQLLMVGGSPGGALIIAYVSKWLWASLHAGLPLADTMALPNMAQPGSPALLLEAQGWPKAHIEALQAMGHRVQTLEMTSGLHVLERHGQDWLGAADPRREGAVRGR